MPHPHRGLNTIQIVGAGPDDAIGLALRKAFDNVLFFPDKALPSHKSDLAIGISTRCEDARLPSFTHWAHDAEVPAFVVEIRNDAVLIGSLTVAGRPGCGRCVSERITAARITSESNPEQSSPVSLEEIYRKIAPILVREIQAIETDGFEECSLLDHVLVVDVQTLDESLHKVIPLARCAVCGGATAFPLIAKERSTLSAEDPPEIVLGSLAGWVDQFTGVISNLFIEPPDDPRLGLPIIATAAPPHIIENDGWLRRLPIGWGKGLTISGAVLSAVGEAIERYSASLVDTGQIAWKRPDELEGEFLDPRDCGLYSEEQYERENFPYVRFNPNIAHPWIRGRWLNGNPVWIPAISVLLSLELRQEQSISQGTSNGLAASINKDDAALRAIFELVERDAVMATWLTSHSTQRLHLDDSLDPRLRTVLNGIESLGATIEIYTLPISVIGTTVLCLALGDGEHYPGITFGLGCDLDPQAALRQAVLELGQTGPYLRRMMRSRILTPAENASDVREMLDHASYYFPKERASAFDRLRNENTTVSLGDLKRAGTRSLSDCASALEAAGVRVALVDVTSADVATGPFVVMRAVSPDLQPISYGYGLERMPVARVLKMKVAEDVPLINPIW